MPLRNSDANIIGLFGAGSGNVMVSTFSKDPAKCLPSKGKKPGLCFDDANCCEGSTSEKHSSRLSRLLFGVLSGGFEVGSCV